MFQEKCEDGILFEDEVDPQYFQLKPAQWNANFINSNPSNRNLSIKGFHGNNSCQLSINAHSPIFLKYCIEL